MAKRMLVIADSNALWTKRFLEHVALPAGYEIVVFPIWGHDGKFDDFYRENRVTIYRDEHTLPVIRHIPRVRMWARVWRNAQSLLKLGPFDVVHNHYISQRDLALGYAVSRRCGARWVASIWGSDLLRASPKEQRREAFFLKKCDRVHVNTQLTANKLREVCGEAIEQKLTLVDFGQIGYTCINQVRREWSKADCKRHFGIDPDSFALCVGYSASSAQQQLQVLESMQHMPQEVLQKITIVLQQTYCLDDPDYVERTRRFAQKLPCACVVMTEFMNDMECARLRLAADAFILSITTDAISGTLREYLYAGTCVIRGSWLYYPQLSEMGIPNHEFTDFAELPGLIEKAMNGMIEGPGEKAQQRLAQEYSWEAVLPGWLSLYQK